MAYSAKDSLPMQTSSLPPPPSSSPSSSSRISPAVLFVIVILAVIFFVSGLLHLLVRFLIKKSPAPHPSGPHPHPGGVSDTSDALQRQLQQLFHLHDSGLDQASIDALPVFLYRELTGCDGDPFDCAVCLCEFSRDDRLRLLPACRHAFHLDCIDTWLLSNSTCPLCRGTLLFVPTDNPVFGFDDSTPEDRPVPVRLGKFRCTSGGNDRSGESSSSNLDARRCYSMGSYQYVVGDAELRVVLNGRRGMEKELRVARKGESFSVSKIWLWKNKKGKFPGSSDASSLDGGLPWMNNARSSVGDV